MPLYGTTDNGRHLALKGKNMGSLNEDLKNNIIHNAYLFCGEEDYLKSHYKKRFTEMIAAGNDMNVETFEGNKVEVGDIIDAASTAPFFAEHKLIILDGTGLFSEKGKPLADFMKSMPESTVLMFIEDDVKKTTALYKVIKEIGSITEFKREGEKSLIGFAKNIFKQNKIKITEKDATYLVNNVGDDMELLSREVEKLISYCLDRKEVTAADIDEICTKQLSVKIFDMMDYMSVKDKAKTLDEFYKLIADKEPPARILGMIARQFDILLLIKDLMGRGMSKSEIMNATGMSEFVVRKSMGQCRHFSIRNLVDGFYASVKAEEDFKSGLILDEVLAIELLIVDVTSK